MTARYGQLSYTSFDTADHQGGWQVKETSAGLTPDEVQALTAGVRTVFRPAEPMPAYPTPEQLARGPRRLAYGRLDGRRAGFWHTVPAGSDSTGRPGNVFAHAMIDRSAADRSQRPIQWWRSADWLCPYGPTAVAAAGLPAAAPTAGTAVTRDSVIDFALDPDTWRLATLFVLLDAVAGALAGGRPVVLGVESSDAAAQWIGLVSFLMSAGTAATFNFSTFDRADQLALARQSHQHLTAVPIGDVDELPDDVVAIGENTTFYLGELDREPHRTADGQTVTVTPWSAMAQVVLLDAGSAAQVLEDIDHYAAEVADTGLHPAWPMAMSVAHRPEFADALTEARGVIAAHSPWATSGSIVARTLADVMRGTLGTSTEDAWRAVRTTPRGPAADLAAATYLQRALTDPQWLDQPGAIPVAEDRFEHHAVPSQLREAIGPALESARAAGPERVLRVADLLLRSGIRDDRVLAALDSEVASSAAESAPVWVGRPATRYGVVTRLALASVLLRRPADPGPEVSTEVLDWLADGVKAPGLPEVSRAEPWDGTWTRAALRGAHEDRTGTGSPADRWAALWWLRVSGSARFTQVAGASVWTPEELLAAAGDTALPGAAAVRTLAATPDSPGVDHLARTVLSTNCDDVAVACAAVRVFDPRTWVEHGYAASHQAAYTPLWERAVTTLDAADIHRDFAVRLVTFAAIAAAAGQPYPPACQALAGEVTIAGEVFRHLVGLLDAYLINPVSLLAVAALRWADSGDDNDAVYAGVDDLVWQLARHVLRTRNAETLDVTTIAATMAQLSGESADGAVRRHRKTVARLLARRHEMQTAPMARTRWSQ